METSVSQLVAFVGIDWADQKHYWALQAAGSQKIERGELEHTPEAIAVWAAELQQRFPGGRIAIALEQSRGALVFMLSKYDHLVIYPIHASSAQDYRKAFRPSGAKSDGADAALWLDMLVRHPDKLRALQPDTPETRTLQFLVEHRRRSRRSAMSSAITWMWSGLASATLRTRAAFISAPLRSTTMRGEPRRSSSFGCRCGMAAGGSTGRTRVVAGESSEA